MKKNFSKIFIITIIMFVVYIASFWYFAKLPSINTILWGFKNFVHVQQPVTEYYRHYNNRDFGYIYDFMYDPEMKIDVPRRRFEKYLSKFYDKYGYMIKPASNEGFEYLPLSKLLPAFMNKSVKQNTFYMYKNNRNKNIFVLKFRCVYEKGETDSAFELSDDGNSFKIAVPATILKKSF